MNIFSCVLIKSKCQVHFQAEMEQRRLISRLSSYRDIGGADAIDLKIKPTLIMSDTHPDLLIFCIATMATFPHCNSQYHGTDLLSYVWKTNSRERSQLKNYI